MAKAQNPLTGQMSGAVANFVTSTLNGENLIRSKAFNRKDANTPAQQLQRASFKLISDEHKAWGGITAESFPEGGTGQSGYNQFVAINLKEAIDKSNDSLVIDYSKLYLAKGTLLKPLVIKAEIVADGISITYKSQLRVSGVNADDQIIAAAKTQDDELLFEKQVRGDGASGVIVLDYPGILAADVKCCYLYVLNADGRKASASVFVPLSE
jgi:hypothetical protein